MGNADEYKPTKDEKLDWLVRRAGRMTDAAAIQIILLAIILWRVW